MEINAIQLFGYFGSVLIAVSLTMRSIVRLRWINLFGATVFSIYGLLVNAVPVFLLNGFIVLIDIYYLLQMHRQKNFFEILEKSRIAAPYLQRFFKFYEKDITVFFPDFQPEKIINPLLFIILRDMMPIGVFIGEPTEVGTLEIKLDYVIPDYRDLKSAYFLYGKKQQFFRDNKISRLEIKSDVDKHVRFLEKMGFKRDVERGEHWYYKALGD
ncbi:MAG: hypothetical protein DWQ05_04290 [Calditrichaeota bacterium]|nr:MAG: hypothetical protein DWQ05_04290 [Calditrichota bacterium]